MSVFGDPLLSRLASPFEAANDAAESTSRPTPRVFIKSFGCQMNVYDSQRMADLAVGEGYTETQTIADADLVVLNTCHIRERASEKVFSELGKIRELKERRAAARPRDHARGGRLRRAGRGRRKSCAASPPSISSWVRKTIIGCRSC